MATTRTSPQHPVCRHWIGRFDPDTGLEGALHFLDGTEFSPRELPDDIDPWDRPPEPDAEALHAAFGAYYDIAVATYSEGFDLGASGVQLLQVLIEQLEIRELKISGDGVMGWSYYDYYAADPDSSLTAIRNAVAAIRTGMTALNRPSPAD